MDNKIITILTIITLVTIWVITIFGGPNYVTISVASLATFFSLVVIYHMMKTESDTTLETIVKVTAAISVLSLSAMIGTVLVIETMGLVFAYVFLITTWINLSIIVFEVGFPKTYRQLFPFSFWLLFIGLIVCQISLFASKVLLLLFFITLLLATIGRLINK